MDEQPERTDISPETAASVAAARRKLDAIAAKASAPRRADERMAKLEATVGQLAQVVGALAQTVTRLADQRLDESTMTTSELIERATRDVDAMVRRREGLDGD